MKIRQKRVEVIKLYNRGTGGRSKWVMSKNDLHRILYKYNFTLDKFVGLGIGRRTWINTLEYYKLNLNDIEGLRKMPYIDGNIHGNSGQGFTSHIDINKLRAQNESLIAQDLKRIELVFPGTIGVYSTYHTETLKTSRYFSDLQRTIFDISLSIKKAHARVSKWAKRNNLPYYPIIKSKLEHHFAKILDDLEVSYIPQWPYRGYWYDFYLPELGVLLEIDGGEHSGKTDVAKDNLAKKLELNLVRLEIKDMNSLRHDYNEIKNKVSKIIGL